MLTAVMHQNSGACWNRSPTLSINVFSYLMQC